MLHKFLALKFYHGNQTKQAVSEVKTFKNKMAAVVAILFFSVFQLASPNSLGEVKNCFQDGRYGGHFGFSIGMILAFFSSTHQPVATL